MTKDEMQKFFDEAFTQYELEIIREYAKTVAIEFQGWIRKEEITWNKSRGDWQRWIPFDLKSKALIYYTDEQLYVAFEKAKSKFNQGEGFQRSVATEDKSGD